MGKETVFYISKHLGATQAEAGCKNLSFPHFSLTIYLLALSSIMWQEDTFEYINARTCFQGSEDNSFEAQHQTYVCMCPLCFPYLRLHSTVDEELSGSLLRYHTFPEQKRQITSLMSDIGQNVELCLSTTICGCGEKNSSAGNNCHPKINRLRYFHMCSCEILHRKPSKKSMMKQEIDFHLIKSGFFFRFPVSQVKNNKQKKKH